MAKPLIKLEGLTLIAIGSGAGWFALFGNYGLLMNPKYQYMTAAGAAIVLLIGLAVLWSKKKTNNSSGLIIFGLLIAVVLVGKPFISNNSAAGIAYERGLSTPPSVIGDANYTNMDLAELYLAITKKNVPREDIVTTGIVKRLPELDRVGQFALMKTVVVCCLADAISVGVRVSFEKAHDLKDGAWVNVYGRIKETGAPFKTPYFRMGPVMFTSVNEAHVIEPDKVAAYDPASRLKTLFEELASDRLSTFASLIQKAGFEKTLKNNGLFTILAPINEAFDVLPEGKLEALFKPENKDDLKKFVSRHIIKGRIMEKDMFELTSLTTIEGQQLNLNVKNGVVYIEASRILFWNKMARNGVVHMVYPDLISGLSDEP